MLGTRYVIVMKSEVVNISNMRIGNGEESILLDTDTMRPVIPASGIAGAFRNYLSFAEPGNRYVDMLFGEKGGKSRLFVKDAVCKDEFDGSLELRDRVCINPRTATGGEEKFTTKMLGAGWKFDISFTAEAENEEEKNRFLREHIASLRSHVKLLSEKNYQNALNVNTPDFVLMFLPVESSFSVALQGDTDLFSYAWERKIVIVCPTTLLATLRTIASIWKQENQTKNAQEIARLSGALYDKFIGFTEDMQRIKTNIDRVSTAYDEAFKKMKTGNGNMVRTAERIKELGAKVGNKPLPAEFEVE